MKEMKKIKKIMSMVLVIATLFTTFSQTVQASPVKMNTISNGIEMVEKNFRGFIKSKTELFLENSSVFLVHIV